MILADQGLARALDTGHLVVDPMDDDQLQPASIDLRLDQHFRRMIPASPHFNDPSEDIDLTYGVAVPDGGHLILRPGEFALAATFERVALAPHLCARWEGKSSIGRRGLATHVTAGFIDPGFDGHITLELANLSPLPWVLYPGMRIGQLCVMEMTSAAVAPYGSAAAGSHYQGQRGPTPSRSHLNFRHDLPTPTPQETHL